MKRISFTSTQVGEVDFEKFTCRVDISVKHIHTFEGNGGIASTMVYYEDLTEITTKEKMKLAWIREKAIALALDEKYQKLSNATQRKFYLLETYGYCSTDSADIIEYLGMMKKLAGE